MTRFLLLLLLLCAALATAGCSHVRMALFMRRDNPTENDPDSISRGRRVFAERCAVCHGDRADGTGARAAELKTAPTDFLAAEYTKSAPRIAARIAYGKGDEMPAFVGSLSEQAIWDTANFLRSLQQPATGGGD